MRLSIIIIFLILMVSCDNDIEQDFFANSSFTEVIDSDSTFISFTDSSYAILSKNGIQQNGNWSITKVGNEPHLILGSFDPSIFKITSFTSSSCTLQKVDHNINETLTFNRSKTNKLDYLGTWKSRKFAPPPDYLLNDSIQFDSIMNQDSLWQEEVFEFTEDSVTYSFYNFRASSKYKRPFLQLDKNISSFGILNTIRIVELKDSMMTIELFLTDGNFLIGKKNRQERRSLRRY